MKAFNLLILFSLASALCFAENWTGKLVDAACVEQAQGKAANCMPTTKTGAFALDTGDGKVFRLDAAGNAKAAATFSTGNSLSSMNCRTIDANESNSGCVSAVFIFS